LLLALVLGCHVRGGGATTTTMVTNTVPNTMTDATTSMVTVSEGMCRFVNVGNGWCTSSEAGEHGASQKYGTTAQSGRSGIKTESECQDVCDADQACTAYNYFPCGGPNTCGCFIYVPSKSSGPAGWAWHAAYLWTSNMVIDKGSGSGSTTCLTCERNVGTGTTTTGAIVSTTTTTLPDYEIHSSSAICLFLVEEQCNSFQMCMDGCDTDPNCKYFVFSPGPGAMDYCYLADTCQVMRQGGSSIYKKKVNGGANTGGGSPQTVTLTGSMTVTVASPQTFIGDSTATNAVGKALSAMLNSETPSCIRVSVELAGGGRRLDSRRLSGNVQVDYAITIPSSSDAQKVSTALSTKSASEITTAVQEKLTEDKVSYSVTVNSGATLSGPATGGTSSVTVATTGAVTAATSTSQSMMSSSLVSVDTALSSPTTTGWSFDKNRRGNVTAGTTGTVLSMAVITAVLAGM